MTTSTASLTQNNQSYNDPLTDIHLIIGAKLRVTMTDGRVAHGTFVGLDRLCNIILDNVMEYRDIAYIAPNYSHPSCDGNSTPKVDDYDGNKGGNNDINCNAEKGKNEMIVERQQCNVNGISHSQKIYRWNTERSLSQAVIRGDRLAKVEIVKEDWTKRTGRSTVSNTT